VSRLSCSQPTVPDQKQSLSICAVRWLKIMGNPTERANSSTVATVSAMRARQLAPRLSSCPLTSA